jgi:hypothetical protein
VFFLIANLIGFCIGAVLLFPALPQLARSLTQGLTRA